MTWINYNTLEWIFWATSSSSKIHALVQKSKSQCHMKRRFQQNWSIKRRIETTAQVMWLELNAVAQPSSKQLDLIYKFMI